MVTVIPFHHNNKRYEVNVHREKRKDLRIKIRRTGELVALIPRDTPLSALEEMLARRREEVGLYLDKMTAYAERIPKYRFDNGDRIDFAGRTYKIVTHPIKSGYKIKASLDETRSEIHIASSGKSGENTADSYAHQAAEAVETLLMTLAKSWISERAAHFASQMSLYPKAVKISRAKTRYGSCSSKGSLNFCWRILLAPTEVADYIIVHELAHLAQLNHSKAFYAIVEQAMPDYKNAQSWLKRNAALLEWPV